MRVDDDLLCVADTKLVMGNWLAECVMNGNSLPDFAAVLGMCSTSYGQTRAIYQHVGDGADAYARLERGRGPEEIHSMELLDAAPRDWEDFLVSVWLAEQAAWSLMSGFTRHPDRTVSALARKIGEETYFHLKYASGWFTIFTADDGSRKRMEASLGDRLPLAVDWFGPVTGEDPLFAGGERSMTVADLRESFLGNLAEVLRPFRITLPSAEADLAGEWRPLARRRGPLPQGLYEVIRFKDPAMAH
jgi:ring-1,2-phenylacetyl-CoA epoxidase subunit PaaC